MAEKKGKYDDFLKEDDINKRVDEKIRQSGKPKTEQVRDKIQLTNKVKTNLSPTGALETQVPDGVYAVDCNALLRAQISDCPSTVIPMLIDHGIRTAVDIRNTYRPEKRLPSFNLIWLLLLIVGFGIFILFANNMFHFF